MHLRPISEIVKIEPAIDSPYPKDEEGVRGWKLITAGGTPVAR